MKKFYIVDINGNKIIYVSTEKKAKLFAEVRGGKLKEASDEEKDFQENFGGIFCFVFDVNIFG